MSIYKRYYRFCEEMKMDFQDIYQTRAAAAVRGHALRTPGCVLPENLTDKAVESLGQVECTEILGLGKVWDVKLYRFKRGHEDLPRVKQVLGFLKGVCPGSLLDVGSGRGVFLFPFLNSFPKTEVTSLDILDHRVQFLEDIRQGGISNLTPMLADICTQPLPDKSADVVTMLEVLEHIPDVQAAVTAAVHIARHYVVVTVPSKPDDNPEHIHLLTKPVLTELFKNAGCDKLHFSGVPGHLILMVTVSQENQNE